ncbi:MAG TPA: hypothetical protein VM534_06170, partial [Thermoanaerobaculia bacterium]|nr:hypothetical protein [Thermoanaerobaculia bacterium]
MSDPIHDRELIHAAATLRAEQASHLEGILVTGRGTEILASNERLFELWGLHPTRAVSGSLLRLGLRQMLERREALEALRQMREDRFASISNHRIRLRDGRTLAVSSIPLNHGTGGRVWYFR